MLLYESKAKDLVLTHDTHVGGLHSTPLRWVAVNLGERYGQYDHHLSVYFIRPRKRKKEGYTLSPDGLAWYTIQVAGATVWDSRQVPGFQVYADLEEARALTPGRHGLGPGPENDAAVARWDAAVAALPAYLRGG